ncbi:MAG: ribonuclease J [Tissierellia bacterium]|nr:ribonuclease J [Tissierellia bacterium]
MGKRNKEKLKIIPLGGLAEIGKNMTVVEYGNDIIIVDCGLTFPDEDMLGIDIVIPDITYLEKNVNKIRGIILTHGHEDHIGAVPYVLKKLNIPVYGTRLTLGLLKNKFQEHKLNPNCLKEIQAGQSVRLGVFNVEPVQASHSIPDSVSFAIKTPVGTIIFTGDFKIDYTPIDGDLMDLPRLAALGDEGVLALLADSTNIEREGYSVSERTVGETFKDVFGRAESRLIVATFASNLHRVQQVITAAEYYGKKVAISGRSMINTVGVALDLGYLNVKKGTIIDINEIRKYPGDKIVILTTGSQGEPMSALTRMANGDHRKVQLSPEDTVLISASPIPGNEKTVFNVLNKLTEIGVKIIYQALADVHVSGHAFKEELKLIHTLVRPKFFIPVHGEQRHLKLHAKLAMELGMDEKNIKLGNNGTVFELDENSIAVSGIAPAGNVLVDGLGVGDVGNVVLRDRKHLSEDGLIAVVITISKQDKHVVAGPDIISRGFVYVKESGDLMDDAKNVVEKTLKKCRSKNISDWGTLKYNIRDDLKSFIYHEIKRNPMILPIIMEV